MVGQRGEECCISRSQQRDGKQYPVECRARQGKVEMGQGGAENSLLKNGGRGIGERQRVAIWAKELPLPLASYPIF